jgi:hypothetical protein
LPLALLLQELVFPLSQH